MRRTSLVVAPVGVLLLSSLLFAQDWSQPPLYGALTLTSGFLPDPQYVHVVAGGSDEVGGLNLVDQTGGICTGFIAASQPDIRIHFTAGSTFPLRIYAQAEADTTLVVNLPDTSWRCSDDFAGFNPLVQIVSPASGQYDVWVGVWGTGSTAPATLYVSELTTAGPTP